MAVSGTAVDDTTGTDNGMPTAWVRAGRQRRSATSGSAPEKRSAELGERPAPLRAWGRFSLKREGRPALPPGLLLQAAYPGDDGLDHGLRLLRQQGVAGVADHGDRDAVAELVLELVHALDRMKRVVVGLQVEQRHGAGRPPFRLPGGERGDTLSLARVRVPAVEPDGGVATRRKERAAQIFEPLLLRTCLRSW